MSRDVRQKLMLSYNKLSKSIVSVDTRDLGMVLEFCDTYIKRIIKKDVKYNKDVIEKYLDTYAMYGIKSGSSYSGLIVVKPMRVDYYITGVCIEFFAAYESAEYAMSEILYNLSRNLEEKGMAVVQVIYHNSHKAFMDVFENNIDMSEGFKYSAFMTNAFKNVNKEDKDLLGNYVVEKFGYMFKPYMPELNNYETYKNSSPKKRKRMRLKEQVKYIISSCILPCRVKFVINNHFYENLCCSEDSIKEDIYKDMRQIGAVSSTPLSLLILIVSLILGFSVVWSILLGIVTYSCCFIMSLRYNKKYVKNIDFSSIFR